MKYLYGIAVMFAICFLIARQCYNYGYQSCDISYQQLIIMQQQKNKQQTYKLEQELQHLKSQEYKLNDNCQKIWKLDISSCRQLMQQP